jgi:magnesium-transporting ATPase (P-type)
MESGDGHMLVVAVGMNSQSGSHMMDIQQMAEEDEKSSLEKKLDKIAMLLTWIGMCDGIVTAVVLAIFRIVAGVEQQNWKEKINEVIEWQTIRLSFVVAFSHGFLIKKKKDNNIVRLLQACETMGGVATISSDKTWMQTPNRKTAMKFFMDGDEQW